MVWRGVEQRLSSTEADAAKAHRQGSVVIWIKRPGVFTVIEAECLLSASKMTHIEAPNDLVPERELEPQAKVLHEAVSRGSKRLADQLKLQILTISQYGLRGVVRSDGTEAKKQI